MALIYDDPYIDALISGDTSELDPEFLRQEEKSLEEGAEISRESPNLIVRNIEQGTNVGLESMVGALGTTGRVMNNLLGKAERKVMELDPRTTDEELAEYDKYRENRGQRFQEMSKDSYERVKEVSQSSNAADIVAGDNERLGNGIRSATSSIEQMLGLAATGTGSVGVIAGFTALAGDSAYNQALDAKLPEEEAIKFGIKNAIIEGSITSLFQGAGKYLQGAAGFEGLLKAQNKVKGGLVEGWKRAGKTSMYELTEEETIGTAQALLSANEGVDPEAMEWDNLVDMWADTAISTGMTVGAMGGGVKTFNAAKRGANMVFEAKDDFENQKRIDAMTDPFERERSQTIFNLNKIARLDPENSSRGEMARALKIKKTELESMGKTMGLDLLSEDGRKAAIEESRKLLQEVYVENEKKVAGNKKLEGEIEQDAPKDTETKPQDTKVLDNSFSGTDGFTYKLVGNQIQKTSKLTNEKTALYFDDETSARNFFEKRRFEYALDAEDVKKVSDDPGTEATSGINKAFNNLSEDQKIRPIAVSIDALNKAESDPVETLNQLHILKTRLDKWGEGIPDSGVLRQEVDNTEKALLDQGYEVDDMVGQKYNDVMNINPTFVVDENAEEGSAVITKAKTPAIYKDGKLVSLAEVEVTLGPDSQEAPRKQPESTPKAPLNQETDASTEEAINNIVNKKTPPKRKPGVARKKNEYLDWEAGDRPLPGEVVPGVRVDQTNLAPGKLQFRTIGVNEDGSSGSLDEIKKKSQYDEEKFGVPHAWYNEKEDKIYIVNGHNRRSMLVRFGIEEYPGLQFIAANSFEEAQASGALLNLDDGNGTALDAAIYFRFSGDTKEQLSEKGVRIKGKIIDDGLALAKLADPLFAAIRDGSLETNQGVIIGKALENKDKQVDLLGRVLKHQEKIGRKISQGDLKNWAERKASGKTFKLVQNELFAFETDVDMDPVISDIQTYVIKTLKTDMSDFNTIVKKAGKFEGEGNELKTENNKAKALASNQSLELFQLLKNDSGPINDALEKAAIEIIKSEGKTNEINRIKREALEEIKAIIPTLTAGRGKTDASKPASDAGSTAVLEQGTQQEIANEDDQDDMFSAQPEAPAPKKKGKVTEETFETRLQLPPDLILPQTLPKPKNITEARKALKEAKKKAKDALSNQSAPESKETPEGTRYVIDKNVTKAVNEQTEAEYNLQELIDIRKQKKTGKVPELTDVEKYDLQTERDDKRKAERKEKIGKVKKTKFNKDTLDESFVRPSDGAIVELHHTREGNETKATVRVLDPKTKKVKEQSFFIEEDEAKDAFDSLAVKALKPDTTPEKSNFDRRAEVASAHKKLKDRISRQKTRKKNGKTNTFDEDTKKLEALSKEFDQLDEAVSAEGKASEQKPVNHDERTNELSRNEQVAQDELDVAVTEEEIAEAVKNVEAARKKADDYFSDRNPTDDVLRKVGDTMTIVGVRAKLSKVEVDDGIQTELWTGYTGEGIIRVVDTETRGILNIGTKYKTLEAAQKKFDEDTNINNSSLSKDKKIPVLDPYNPTPKGYNHTYPIGQIVGMQDKNVSIEKLKSEERGYLDNLKKKILKDGLQSPIDILVVDGEMVTVWDGMHRLAVLTEVDMGGVPVRYVDKEGNALGRNALNDTKPKKSKGKATKKKPVTKKVTKLKPLTKPKTIKKAKEMVRIAKDQIKAAEETRSHLGEAGQIDVDRAQARLAETEVNLKELTDAKDSKSGKPKKTGEQKIHRGKLIPDPESETGEMWFQVEIGDTTVLIAPELSLPTTIEDAESAIQQWKDAKEENRLEHPDLMTEDDSYNGEQITMQVYRDAQIAEAEFNKENLRVALGMVERNKDDAKPNEYVIWGVPKGEKDEAILFTKAKTKKEAESAMKALKDNGSADKMRIQTIDFSSDLTEFQDQSIIATEKTKKKTGKLDENESGPVDRKEFDEFINLAGRFFRGEKVVTRKKGNKTLILLDGKTIVTVDGNASQEKILKAIGNRIQEIIASGTDVSMPQSITDMTREQFAVSKEIAGFNNEFEIEMDSLDDVGISDDGTLSLSIDKIYDGLVKQEIADLKKAQKADQAQIELLSQSDKIGVHKKQYAIQNKMIERANKLIALEKSIKELSDAEAKNDQDQGTESTLVDAIEQDTDVVNESPTSLSALERIEAEQGREREANKPDPRAGHVLIPFSGGKKGKAEQPISTGNPEADQEIADSRVNADDVKSAKKTEYWKDVRNKITRVHSELPNDDKFAPAREIIRLHREVEVNAQRNADRILKAILDPLDSDVQDKMLFETWAMMLNVVESMKMGEMGSYGFKNIEEAKAALRNISIQVKARPNVVKAYKNMRDIFNGLATELKDKGVINEEVSRKHYIHNQIGHYMVVESPGNKRKAIERSKAGFAHRRVQALEERGQSRDPKYNPNIEFIIAQREFLTDAYRRLGAEETISKLNRIYNTKGELKEQAKLKNDIAFRGGIAEHKRFETLKANRRELMEMKGKGAKQRQVQIQKLYEEMVKIDSRILENKRIAQGFATIRKEYDDGNIDLSRNPQFAKMLERMDQDTIYEDNMWSMMAWMAASNDFSGYSAKASQAARMVFKNIRKKENKTKDKLKSNFNSWQSLARADEKLALWQPDPGNLFYKATTISEKLIEEGQKLIAEQMENNPDWMAFAELGKTAVEEAGSVIALGGPKEQLVFPVELANQLDKLTVVSQEDALATQWNRKLVSTWKKWILNNPFTTIPYNLRNFAGDLDAAVAGNPEVLKFVIPVLKEMWMMKYRNQAKSADYIRSQELGVFSSGSLYADVYDVAKSEDYRKFFQDMESLKWSMKSAGPKLMDMYNDLVVDKMTAGREGILRYAAYKSYLGQLQAQKDYNGKKADALRKARMEGKKFDAKAFKSKHGKPTEISYGASKRSEVEAIQETMSIEEAAAHLARNLLGDYSNLTAHGDTMRRALIPFWAFTELNMRRYQRIARNGLFENKGKGLIFGTYFAGKMMARMFALNIAISAWNHIMFPDEEEALSEWDRNNPHIIIRSNDDGTIMILRNSSSLGDLLGWIGGYDLLDDLTSGFETVRNGQEGVDDILKGVGTSAFNKLIGSIGPTLKGTGEVITGQSLFPDPTNPRPKSRDEIASSAIGMEFFYRSIKEAVMKQGDSTSPHQVQRTITGTTNSKQNAINDMYKWLKMYSNKEGLDLNSGGSRVSSSRFVKSAIKNNDKDAFKLALKKHLESGKGFDPFTGYMDGLDPLQILKKNDGSREKFLDEFLTPEQATTVEDARLYAQELREKGYAWYHEAINEMPADEVKAYKVDRAKKIVNAAAPFNRARPMGGSTLKERKKWKSDREEAIKKLQDMDVSVGEFQSSIRRYNRSRGRNQTQKSKSYEETITRELRMNLRSRTTDDEK